MSACAWSKLPNAKHIDAVLASVKANPKIWRKALEKTGGWTEARQSAWNEARDMVQYAKRDAVWHAAWDELWYVTRHEARQSASGTIMALLAYDDCAHLLSANPEHVKMMAGLGDEAAILLYPAVLALSEIKNECLV